MCFCRAYSVDFTIIDTWEVYLLHVSLYVYEISPNLSLTIASQLARQSPHLPPSHFGLLELILKFTKGPVDVYVQCTIYTYFAFNKCEQVDRLNWEDEFYSHRIETNFKKEACE